LIERQVGILGADDRDGVSRALAKLLG
jgi:hypothetical protein